MYLTVWEVGFYDQNWISFKMACFLFRRKANKYFESMKKKYPEDNWYCKECPVWL